MNKLIRSFLEGLHDRVIASVGSIIGNTFSTFRAVQHAEQQSVLEDLARGYEAEGKAQLAEQIREQALRLNMDDPGMEARLVFRNVLEDRSALPALTHECGDESQESTNGRMTTKKKRRTRRPATPVDDIGISLDD